MKQKKSSFDWYATRQRFSIRKYHIGAASVLLGTALVLGNAATVSADENTPAIVATAEATEVAEASQAPAVDKTALTQAVETAKAIDLANKPAELAESFVEVFTQATDVLNNNEATQEDVDAVLTKLNEAVEAIQAAATVEVAPAVLGTPVATPDADELAPVAETTEETATEAPAAEEAAEVNEAGTEAATVTFYNEAGQAVDPNQVLETGDGQNISLKVKVSFNDGASIADKKVTLTLGNFMHFRDVSRNNEDFKKFVDAISDVTYTRDILTENGQKYLGADKATPWNEKTGASVTYTVKAGVAEFTIPINFYTNRRFGVEAIATDGTIPGKTTGVEESTPLLVTVTGSKNGAAVRTTTSLNRIAFPEASTNGASYDWFNNHATDPAIMRLVSSREGYEFVVPFRMEHIGLTGNRTFRESARIDIVIPKGVTFLGLKDGLPVEAATQSAIWNLKATTPEADGATRLTFETKVPTTDVGYALYPLLKVDRSVVTGNTVTVTAQNHYITYRNGVVSENKLGNNGGVTRHIVDFSDNKDNISFFNYYGSLAEWTEWTRLNLPKEHVKDKYVSLGWYAETANAINYDDKDSREKELVYTFPENEYVDVKGFRLPNLQNDARISSIKVKTKNSPVLREVQLGKTYDKNSTEPVWLDITDLGYSSDDVLQEVVMDIGVLKAKTSYNFAMNDRNKSRRTDVFGLVKRDIGQGKNTTSTIITLRDKGYNPADPARNQVNNTAYFKVFSGVNEERNDIRVEVGITKDINYGQVGTINYNITATDDAWMRHNLHPEEVNKVYLTLPTAVKPKAINLYFDSEYNWNVGFTPGASAINLDAQLLRTERVSGENTIYTLDLSNVNRDHKTVGWYAKKGSSNFTFHSLKAEVVVDNTRTSELIVDYTDRLSVSLPYTKPNKGVVTVASDKYDVDGDGQTTNDTDIFTNVASTNFVRLNSADRIDFKSDGKIGDSGYLDAGSNFRIVDIGTPFTLKNTIVNPLSKEVPSVDLLLPIPKQGQNWGTNFQDSAFSFGLNLIGLTPTNAKFNEIFEISYATVDAAKLNGTANTFTSLTTNQAFGSTFNESTNLIRIKTKSGVKIPANTEVALEASYRVANPSPSQDGNKNTWNSIYRGTFESGTLDYETRETNLSIALGKLGFTFFNDANATGSKEGAEAAFTGTAPTYEIFNSRNEKVDLTGLTTASRGGTVVNGLTSTQNYTVRLTAPAGFRFTTGTKGAGATTTTHTLTAALTVTDSVVLDNIGLTPVITITDPAKVTVNDIKNVSAAEKEQVKTALTTANANKFPANTRFDVAADGTVTVTYPDGFTQTIPGIRTVQQRATSAAPTINAIDNDDTTISGTGVTGATVTVNIPGQGSRTVPVTNGTWTITGVTPLATGANVTVTQTEPNKLVSPTVTKAVVAAPSAKPVINKVDTDDRTITGTGVPGATIRVTVPGVAAPIVAQVGTNGQWSVPLTTPLTAGQTVTATQTEPNKAATAADPKTVERTQADQYNPTAKTPHTVAMGSDPVAKDALNTTGLPATGVKYEWATVPDTRTAGTNRTGVVRVTYADGSVDLVNVSLTVTDQRQLADIHEPIGQDITINAEEAVTPISRIVNTNQMPPNTTYEWENGAPDLSVSGTSRLAYVKVKYSDGSSDSVQVRINIRPNMAQLNIPQGQVPGNLRLSMSLTPESLIKNVATLPANTKFTWSAQPNMTTRGAKVARVRVTYTDGSTEEVIVRFNLR